MKTTEGYVQYIIEVFIISTHYLPTHTEIWVLFLLGNNIASLYLRLLLVYRYTGYIYKNAVFFVQLDDSFFFPATKSASYYLKLVLTNIHA